MLKMVIFSLVLFLMVASVANVSIGSTITPRTSVSVNNSESNLSHNEDPGAGGGVPTEEDLETAGSAYRGYYRPYGGFQGGYGGFPGYGFGGYGNPFGGYGGYFRRPYGYRY